MDNIITLKQGLHKMIKAGLGTPAHIITLQYIKEKEEGCGKIIPVPLDNLLEQETKETRLPDIPAVLLYPPLA